MPASSVAAALGVAAGVLALGIALILMALRRKSRVAAALVIVLLAEAVLHLGGGIPSLVAQDAPGVARAAQVGFLAALFLAPAAYLPLLREMPSPLAEWSRRPRGSRFIRWSMPGAVLVGVGLALGAPSVAFASGAVLVLGVNAYAIAVLIDARRRTRAPCALRARANAFLAAFAMRDLALAGAFGLSVWTGDRGAALVTAALGTILYVSLLVAAVVRTGRIRAQVGKRPALARIGRYADPRPVGDRAYMAYDERVGMRVVLERLGVARDALHLILRAPDPRLPRVIATFLHEDRLWTAFEHVEGEPLRHALDEGAMDEAAARVLAYDLCKALVPLHAENIVHGDVTPANIILHAMRGAVLVDLGSARIAGEVSAESSTARHLAPEVSRGLPADARADVYAVGLCVWEALEARPYLDVDGDAMDLRLRAAHPGAFRAPRGASPGLVAWLRRALAEDPERRFSDAAKALAGLP